MKEVLLYLPIVCASALLLAGFFAFLVTETIANPDDADTGTDTDV